MKGNPRDVLIQHNCRSDQHLCEIHDVDPFLSVPVEVNSGFLQELDRVAGVHVLAKIKLEIKLPYANARWETAFRIAKTQPHLDNLKEIYITFQQSISALLRVPERSNWSRDDSRKLGVHRNKRIVVYKVHDSLHLLLQVVRPHFTNDFFMIELAEYILAASFFVSFVLATSVLILRKPTTLFPNSAFRVHRCRCWLQPSEHS
mmetsp:Transcript_5543/g.6750  ORF Transcript_5543/g.6750 Transcript_5543/m.6750 type:complete len:203 (-) Transcript_5543:83-691(-)